MQDLKTQTLVFDDPKARALDAAALTEALSALPGWQVRVVEGISRIEKDYAFENFLDAMAFSNRVAALAESVGHHPALLTEWGKVKVSWWSHSLRGVHHNDLIMAARTEPLAV